MIEAVGVLVLRLVVGGIFTYEGYHKLFHDADVPRGRNGLAALIAKQGMPMPRQLALAVCLIEFVAGLMVVAGAGMRLALVPLIVIVAMATFVFKWKAGFAGGWDWPFSVFGSALALFLIGPGLYSVDAALSLPYLSGGSP